MTTLSGFRVSKHFVVAKTVHGNYSLYNSHGYIAATFSALSTATAMANELEALDLDWSLPNYRKPYLPQLKRVIDKYRVWEV